MSIEPIEFPPYSPDLNPLDYFLWSEVNRRMALKDKLESKLAYMARLRRTAMSIEPPLIKKAIAQMKDRAQAICDNKGGDISLD